MIDDTSLFCVKMDDQSCFEYKTRCFVSEITVKIYRLCPKKV